MKKRIAAGMMMLAFIIFPFCTGLIVFESHNLMLERERTRALSEEAAIARALSKEIGVRGYQGMQEVAQTMQNNYGSEAMTLTFVYNGTPMARKELPDGVDELLKTKGRATLLRAEKKTLYVVHTLHQNLQLLVQSDLSPLYELTKKLAIWSAILCLVGLVVSMLLAFVISAIVMKPVLVLSRAVQKLELGQYDVPLPFVGNDEIGKLTRAFDQMARTVQERERRLREEAIQRQQLLDALAHEMRTPLTALIAGTDMLKCARLTETQKNTLIDTMSGEAKRLSGMEERLSLITSVSHSEPKMEDCALRTLAEEASSVFEKVCVEGGGGTIFCEKELLIELMRNLIVNAKRAGGTAPVKIILQNQGFTVRDEGCGMTQEQMQHAFDPFYKADASRMRREGGAGLGLTLCKKIADLHGAVLSVESAPGKGTSVTYMQKFATL